MLWRMRFQVLEIVLLGEKFVDGGRATHVGNWQSVHHIQQKFGIDSPCR